MYHIPVLLKKVVEILDLKPGEFFIDGTLGSGGHSEVILKKMNTGKFLGVDLDLESLNLTKKRLTQVLKGKQIKLIFRNGNFTDLNTILKQEKLGKANGLLLDLGFSSIQLQSGKGFSFSGKPEPLLMTYSSKYTPVKELLRKMNQKELAWVLKIYGEEKYAKRIAKAIKERERKKPIETNLELAEIVKLAVPLSYRRRKIHPATKTFLALRIFANQELENLEKVLNNLPEILKPNGRVVVISFNSLEDRIVKNKFRQLAKEEKIKVITKKPIVPDPEEIKFNPRSRSAKLRAAIVS